MSVLTFDEVEDCFPQWNFKEIDAQWLHNFAMLHESAVIAKLSAGVSVEPVAQWNRAENYLDVDPPTNYERTLGWEPLYTADALAAARVQALEEAAKTCGAVALPYKRKEYASVENIGDECAAAIRALIGGPNHG